MKDWINQSVFYHIYPLGFAGAPDRNDFGSEPVSRMRKIEDWLPHIESLGVNAIYLGPVFESAAHGYDTADYRLVDRRLGTNADLAALSKVIHSKGMRLVLDGVFNHVGRDFWAFKDLQQKGENSEFQGWFSSLDFNQQSPFGDPFSYEGWAGHYDLVKLNLQNPAVKANLFQTVESWIREFDIDGLRLDAADVMDKRFLGELAAFCKGIKPDFWLMGEVVHGNYADWANPHSLDSVTNYECYKGLYSSFEDSNFFEIAWSLNRQFGPEGIYKELTLYNFADNHDVNRTASQLTNRAHLHPQYVLLFTMPGVPSIYYGSEWGIEGKRSKTSDAALRPCLDLEEMVNNPPSPALPETIRKMAEIRAGSAALQSGDYQQLHVSHQQFAFARRAGNELVIAALNSEDSEVEIEINLAGMGNAAFEDLLNTGETAAEKNGILQLNLHPNWASVLRAVG